MTNKMAFGILNPYRAFEEIFAFTMRDDQAKEREDLRKKQEQDRENAREEADKKIDEARKEKENI